MVNILGFGHPSDKLLHELSFVDILTKPWMFGKVGQSSTTSVLNAFMVTFTKEENYEIK